MIVFFLIAIYLMPVLGIVFCSNLVTILKKVKRDKPTATNTFWLTTSFVLIVWSIAIMASHGL